MNRHARTGRRGFLFSAGGGLAPSKPGEAAQDAGVRRTYTCDVLVCGGGPAGVAAGVNAAREGARVILVERYGRLGGMAVTGLVGPMMGAVKSPFVDEVMRRTSAPEIDPNLLDVEYADLLDEAGARILLHAWVTAVQMDGETIRAVRAASKQGELEFRAGVFIDATGDGDVAFRAGADWEMGRKGDGRCQPASIMFRVAGIDPQTALFCGSEERAVALKVGGRSWWDIGLEANRNGELPPDVGIVRTYRTARPGEVIVNAAQSNGVSGLSVEDLTRAELDGRRQAQRILGFLRRRAPGYETAFISMMPAGIGVRETRRITGSRYLVAEDLMAGRTWPDAVVWEASFPIDIHNPTGIGQASGRFAAKVRPYQIPYGCLLPNKTGNLLTAGRCISGSHEAHASYRVQKIAMATGAAAGAAAGVAVQSGKPLRSLDLARVRRRLV